MSNNIFDLLREIRENNKSMTRLLKQIADTILDQDRKIADLEKRVTDVEKKSPESKP
jgi:hemerythrin superfamily protein